MLMSILEVLPQNINELNDLSHNSFQVAVAVLDCMAELHSIYKPKTIRNCRSLCQAKKFGMYEEVHLIFDTYKQDSLKTLTRMKRQEKSAIPIRYEVDLSTNHTQNNNTPTGLTRKD